MADPISAAIITGLVVGGAATAVSANQQKIAAQKQKDALGDAEKAQAKLLDEQKKLDADRKAKEDLATQQTFAKAASARARNMSGGALPGAVPEQSTVGSVGNAAQASKRLIGS